MTDILIDWINNVPLSRTIHSIDCEFSNGYLIGELLHYHNQIDNFSSFVNKSTPDAQINNFCLLNLALHSLDVHFDTNIALKVINGDTIALGALLFEIRTKLNALKHSSFPVASTDRFKGGKLPLLSSYTKPTKKSFNDVGYRLFERRLRETVENPNNIMLTRVTQRFRDDGLKLTMNATAALKLEEEDIQRVKLDDCSRNRLERRQKRIASEAERHSHELIWENTLDLARKRKSRVQRFSQSCHALQQNTQSIKLSKIEQEAINSCQLFELTHPESSIGDGDFDVDSDVAAQSPTRLTNFSVSMKAAGNIIPGLPIVQVIDEQVLQSNLSLQDRLIQNKKRERESSSMTRCYSRSKYLIDNEAELTNDLVSDCSGADAYVVRTDCSVWLSQERNKLTFMDLFKEAIRQDLTYFKHQQEEHLKREEKFVNSYKSITTEKDNYQDVAKLIHNKIDDGDVNCRKYEAISVCHDQVNWILSLVDSVATFRSCHEISTKREASPIFTCWNDNVLPPFIEFDCMKALSNDVSDYVTGDWFGKWNIMNNNAEKVDNEEKESKHDGISIGNISKVSAANALGEVVTDVRYFAHKSDTSQEKLACIEKHKYMLSMCCPLQCAEGDTVSHDIAGLLNLKVLSVFSILSSDATIMKELQSGQSVSNSSMVRLSIDLIHSFDAENQQLSTEYLDSETKLNAYLKEKQKQEDERDYLTSQVEEYRKMLLDSDEYYLDEISELVSIKHQQLFHESRPNTQKVDLSKKPYDGWIFCDFPRNSTQIVEFVKLLSGTNIETSPLHKYDFKSILAPVSSTFHLEYPLSSIPIGPFLFLMKEVKFHALDIYQQSLQQSRIDEHMKMINECKKIKQGVVISSCDTRAMIDEINAANEVIQSRINKTDDILTNNPQVMLTMQNQWNATEEQFKHSTQRCLDVFKQVSKRLFHRLVDVRCQLRRYFARLDNKQGIVDSFLSDIRLSIFHEDLMFDSQIKNEVLMRTDLLRVNLLNECSTRLTENTAKIKIVSGDAWMNDILASIDSATVSLCQAEYFRLIGSIRLLMDYQLHVCTSTFYPDIQCPINWIPVVQEAAPEVDLTSKKTSKPKNTASKSKLKDKTAIEAEELFDLSAVAQSSPTSPIGVATDWYEQKGFSSQPCQFMNHVYKILYTLPSTVPCSFDAATSDGNRNSSMIDILTSDALDLNIDSLFPNLLDCKNGQSASRIMTRNVADFASKIIESTEKISPGQLVTPSNEVIQFALSADEIEMLKKFETNNGSVQSGKIIAESVLDPLYASLMNETSKFRAKISSILSFASRLQREVIMTSRELFQELLQESHKCIQSEAKMCEKAIEEMQRAVNNSEMLTEEMVIQGNKFVWKPVTFCNNRIDNETDAAEVNVPSSAAFYQVLYSDVFHCNGEDYISRDRLEAIFYEISSHPQAQDLLPSRLFQVLSNRTAMMEYLSSIPTSMMVSNVKFIGLKLLFNDYLN